MDTQPRHRPSRRFVDAKRLIFPCDRETCLHCGQLLVPRRTWYIKKYVQTLDAPVFVAGKSKRCVNPACPHPSATYYASGVLSISLPYSTYGLDVLAFIGWRHEHQHCQLVEIQRELQQRGLLINQRTVGKLYRQFLALLGGMTTRPFQTGGCVSFRASTRFRYYCPVVLAPLSRLLGTAPRPSQTGARLLSVAECSTTVCS